MQKIKINQTQHKFKIDSKRFDMIVKGEVRELNVMPLEKYKIGHRITLLEGKGKKVTGREIVAIITKITDDKEKGRRIYFKKLCIVDKKD